MRIRLAVLAAALALAACQKAPEPAIQPPASAPATPAPPVAAPIPAPPADTIAAYKLLVARQIVAANPDNTFDGPLPAMMPAIVVLDISIDRDGKLKKVRVHRSRDSEASTAALAAVRRVAEPFPPTAQLMRKRDRTLDFSETFLFNEGYQFQLRTLSGPQ
jgi:periplasmic protein TonB